MYQLTRSSIKGVHRILCTRLRAYVRVSGIREIAYDTRGSMSTYEDYTYSVCTDNDRGRKPVGLELYHGLLSTQTAKPFNQIHLLDAGCATGSHTNYLLRHGLGRVTMLDASVDMITVVKNKLRKYVDEGRVHEFRQAILPNIPYDDNSFDAVMFNACLHHMEDGTDSEFQKTAKVIKEAFRVLRPGGLILLQTCSHYQITNCMWFVSLLTDRVLQSMLSRIPSMEQHKQLIKDAGFISTKRYAPVEELFISAEMYHDHDKVSEKDWRCRMSGFAIETPDEIEEMLMKIKQMKAEGTFDLFIDSHEKNRLNSGLLTILVASKPSL